MRTVLVISSDETLQADMRELLPRRGCTSVAAMDRRRAIHLLGREAPDLAVLCLDLAPGNALEVLLEIRMLSPTLPVLAMAGLHRPAYEKRMHAALSFGANETLPKPVEPPVLLECLDRLLEVA